MLDIYNKCVPYVLIAKKNKNKNKKIENVTPWRSHSQKIFPRSLAANRPLAKQTILSVI